MNKENNNFLFLIDFHNVKKKEDENKQLKLENNSKKFKFFKQFRLYKQAAKNILEVILDVDYCTYYIELYQVIE